MEDETCKVALPAGIAPFRSTAVKPFFEENTGGDNGADTQLESDDDINDKIELDDDDAVVHMTENGTKIGRQRPVSGIAAKGD